MPPQDPDDPTIRRPHAPGRELGFIVLSLVLTSAGLLLALPQVMGTGWGVPPPPDAPASTSTGTGPATDRPGVGEEVFANGEAASAFAAAKARATVDIQRLSELSTVSVVGKQRTLECLPGGGSGALSCTVWAYLYVGWSGDFADGHDVIVDGLAGECSFAGTAHMDWTPPAGTSRQQQATCPGRPNLWVHWSTGTFTRGVLACTGTWYNSCAPASAEITKRLPDFDWTARVRIGHGFTVGGDTTPPGGATASPGVPEATATGTSSEVPLLTADEVLDGDVMASVRTKTITQANSDTRRFTTVPGVTLVGSQRGMGCHQLNNHDENQADIRLTCAVWTRQYLAWSGDFKDGRLAIVNLLSHWCAWKDKDAYDQEPQSVTSGLVERPTCPESPFLYVDWALPKYRYAVYPCNGSPRNTCSGANTGSISAKLQDYDWVGSVTIDYQFYKDLK